MTGKTCTLLMAAAMSLPFLVLVAVLWPFTWDDGAITLGFARNLGLHGLLAPGPHSDPVEGYSTFLWLLVGAVPFVTGFGPDGALDLMKLLTVAITLANTALVHRLMRRHLATPALRWAGTLVFLYSSISVLEALDGMETPLLLLLVLGGVLLGERRDASPSRRWAFTGVTSLLALVRFESPFYLLPYVVADLRRHGRAALRRPYPWVWLAVLVAYHVWHFGYFGELLPNTITAKRNLLYSPGPWPLLPYLAFHAKPVIKLVVMFLPFLAWGALAALRRRPGGAGDDALASRSPLPLELLLTLAVGVLLNTAIGNNSGPWNRMIYPVIPLLLLVVLRAVEACAVPALRSGRVVAIAAGLTILVNLAWVPWEIDKLPQVVRARGVIEAVNQVQAASGMAPMTFAGPDMGGAILFGGDLRIIDTGLLCNRRLAREGLEGTAQLVLHDERCHLIESHGPWTTLSRLHEDPRLYQDYRPVWVGAVRLLVRNDVVERLASQGNVVAGQACGDTAPKAGFEADFRMNQRFGGCLRFVAPAS